jgi:hypothetical protein
MANFTIICKVCSAVDGGMGADPMEPSSCELQHIHYYDIYLKKHRPGDYWVELPCGHRQRLFDPIPMREFGAITQRHEP